MINYTMPLTPFHFGPVLFLGALSKRLNLLALLLGSVILDVEPAAVILYNIQYPYRSYPHHGILHSFFGAFLAALLITLLLKDFQAQQWLKRTLTKIGLGWKVQGSSFALLFLSALLGTFSHIIFDSLMHYDALPFWPLSLNNPFLGQISFGQDYFLVILLGTLGTLILILKKRACPVEEI